MFDTFVINLRYLYLFTMEFKIRILIKFDKLCYKQVQ